MEDALSSSQAFIRLLKSHSDPSVDKIELCRQAWEKESLYIPGKASVIVEWILNKLLKERSNDAFTNPLLDFRYMSLLTNILLPNKTAPHWLPPILARIPFTPILASLIHHLPVTQGLPLSLASLVKYLLPLALPKANHESVWDMFWETLYALTMLEIPNMHTVCLEILQASVVSFKQTLAHPSANKKKLLGVFQDSHLVFWLNALLRLGSFHHHLKQMIYEAGEDILFSIEGLRALTINPRPQTMFLKENTVASELFKALTIPPADTNIQHLRPFDGLVLSHLPSLFTSFTKALRTHKNALFGSGSSSTDRTSTQHTSQSSILNSRVKAEAVYFFSRCCSGPLAIRSTDFSDGALKLDIRAKLLELLDTGNCFDNTESNAVDFLKSQAGDLLSFLQNAKLEAHAMRCYTWLLRLDFDLIGDRIPYMLSAVASFSPASEEAALSFLTSLLAYHEKTRTLHEHIHAVLNCLDDKAPLPLNPLSYSAIMSGPLFGKHYRTRLGDAIRVFLTPSQTLEVSSTFQQKLNRLWTQFDTNSGIPNATSLALLSQLATIVLPSLPVNTLPPTSLSEVQLQIHRLFKMVAISRILAAAPTDDGTVETASKSRKKKRKVAQTDDQVADLSWEKQIRIVSALRLGYALQRSASLWLQNEKPIDDGGMEVDSPPGASIHGRCIGADQLVLLLGRVDVVPELKIEIVRVLFYNYVPQYPELLHFEGIRTIPIQKALDTSLDIVAEVLAEDHLIALARWNGKLPHLDVESRSLAVALWDMMVGRWIATIDLVARRDQLTRIAQLLCKIAASKAQNEDRSNLKLLGLVDITESAMLSAQFWELHNFRTALLATMDQQTLPSSAFPASTLILSLQTPNPSYIWPCETVADVMAAFHLLLRFPVEYIGKSSRTEYIKRALATDVAVTLSTNDDVSFHVVLRTFVVRIVKETGANEVFINAADILRYLISSPQKAGGIARNGLALQYDEATLALVNIGYSAIARATAKSEGSHEPFIQLLEDFSALNLFAAFGTQEETSNLQRRSLLCLLETISTHLTPSDVSLPVKALVSGCLNHIGSQTAPVLRSITTFSDDQLVSAFCKNGEMWRFALQAWRVYLLGSKWLEDEIATLHTKSLVPQIIRLLSNAALPGNEVDALCSAYFAATAEEARNTSVPLYGPDGMQMDDSDPQNAEELVSVFIVLARHTLSRQADISYISPKTATEQILETMSNSCKLWSASEYTAVSHLLGEYFASFRGSDFELVAVLRLIVVLLTYAPEGTQKASRKLITNAILFLANEERNSVILSETVSFLSAVASEQSPLLTTLDVSCIWPILSLILSAPSLATLENDPFVPFSAPGSVYTSVASLLVSLIRQRRDLIVHFLPHLTHALNRLLFALRVSREGLNLGRKQRQRVATDRPKWLVGKDISLIPLGAEEAKSLARVLTSMTAKTSVRETRGRGTSQPPGMMESLVKPFSKHAGYVLIAYINAIIGDSLLTIPRTSRIALEDGIFALCEAVSGGKSGGGDFGRDWVMDQLSPDGQKIMKDLWASYEKQKYVGRG